jgi:dihydropteroate synthase
VTRDRAVLACGVNGVNDDRASATAATTPSIRIGPATFVLGARTFIVGVINVSPESFSGDGLASPGAALEQARRFIDDGADILDIGGQSTRPAADKTAAGFDELSPEEEIRRVAPAIERIARALPDAPMSVDTYKPEVARAALEAGAHMLNDIYGFRRDATIARIAAERGVPAVAMHNQRGRPLVEGDVIATIRAGWEESLRIAADAGLAAARVIVDPGFGFGWTVAQNIEMLRRLRELTAPGRALLIGTSRKSSIGAVLGDAEVGGRAWGTAASVALSIANGADFVRVHDVAEMKQVALVADAVARGWRDG